MYVFVKSSYFVVFERLNAFLIARMSTQLLHDAWFNRCNISQINVVAILERSLACSSFACDHDNTEDERETRRHVDPSWRPFSDFSEVVPSNECRIVVFMEKKITMQDNSHIFHYSLMMSVGRAVG